MRPTRAVSLYKHYDSTGKLLYVGVSSNVLTRLSGHKHHSEWYEQIARIDIVHFPSLYSALNAEKAAIQQENPVYNVLHSPVNKIKTGGNRADVSEIDVLNYPLVVAERVEIPVFYARNWGLAWIADHFGTTTEIIKYVLWRYGTIRERHLD